MAQRKFVEAIGRNPGEEKGHSHLYAVMGYGEEYELKPMCRWGWNRSDGMGFSIFRGHRGQLGLCRNCDRNASLGREPVEAVEGRIKTQWI